MQQTFKKFLLLFFFLISSVSYGFCQSQEELKLLKMFYEDKEIVVSSTRYPKSITEIPENITVISKEEIKNLNAHSVADVLERVVGISLQRQGGPGLPSLVTVLAGQSNKVKIMIDGIPINNLSDNVAEVGAIPVQYIERIEIIKGPASNVWGASIGGVINVITKEPIEDNLKGMSSYSFGENDTQDLRLQLTGMKNNFGYYLYAGYMKSDGLMPYNDFYENNFFIKTNHSITEDGKLTFFLGYNNIDRQDGRDTIYNLLFKDNTEQIYSQLKYDHKIDYDTGISFDIKAHIQNVSLFLNQLSSGTQLQMRNFNEKNYIASLKLSTKKIEGHNIVLGIDLERGNVLSDYLNGRDRDLNKFAVFFNDTIKISPKIVLTPGIRYDYVSTVDDFISPSIGMTYNIFDDTILRAYVSRGFGSPGLFQIYGMGFFSLPNKNLTMEKIWAYQLGVECSKIPYLWFKTTFFLYDIEDMLKNQLLPSGFFMIINSGKSRQQGFEFDFKTTPVRKFSLTGGFVFADIRDRDSDKVIKGLPRYSADLGIEYGERDEYNALLKGKYVWWNGFGINNGKYENFIWDFHFYKKIFKKRGYTLQAFGSVRNIFNSSQYIVDPFKTPQRWLELGLRINF